MTSTNVDSIVPVAHILHETDRNLLNVNCNNHTTTPEINADPDLTEGGFISDFPLSYIANHVHHSTSNTQNNYQYYSIT